MAPAPSRLPPTSPAGPAVATASAAATHSLIEEKPGTLADLAMSARVERSIRDQHLVWLRHLPEGWKFRAWPLQLLSHDIS